jgi:uncharacterized protein YggE
VVVRDVSATGAVIDAAADAGGPSFTISGVSFGVAEPSALQSGARQAAMTNAHAIATELARAAGAGLGEVVTIGEGQQRGDGIPRPFAAAKVGAAATPIEIGEQTVQVEVTVTYRLIDVAGYPPPA